MSALTTPARDQLQNRKTLPDLVAAELRERINSGSLPMGAPLNQFALTQELGVSRAVVREAFRQLEAAGMIQLTPYRHAIVIPLGRDDLDDLLEIRTTLESLAAGRAPRRIDDGSLAQLTSLVEAMEHETDGEAWLELDRRFHLAICDASGNPILHRLLDAVRVLINRFIKLTAGGRPRMRSANLEHRAILAALLRRDRAAAETEVRRHIGRTRRMLMGRLKRVEAKVARPPRAVNGIETNRGRTRR